MTDEVNDVQSESADETSVQEQDVQAIDDRAQKQEETEEGLENSLYKDDENSEKKEEENSKEVADDSSDESDDSEDLIGAEPKTETKDESDSDSDSEKNQKDGEADKKGEEKGDGEKSKAPEDYKLELTEDSLLGVDATKDISEFAAKNDMSQEAAEDILKLQEKAVDEYQNFLDETADERAKETVEANRKIWFEQSKKHSVIGGDNYSKFVAAGNRLIKANASPKFIELLKVSGIGNHPDFIEFIGTAGMPMLEDDFDSGSENVDKDTELVDQLYTTMT